MSAYGTTADMTQLDCLSRLELFPCAINFYTNPETTTKKH